MTEKKWGGKRKGAGPPTLFKNDPHVVTVKISGNTKKAMDRIAARKKKTISELIREAILQFWKLPI